MYLECDSVRLIHDLPEYGLRVGDGGAVVGVNPDGESYLVEFVSAKGETIKIVDVFERDLRLHWRAPVPAAHTV